MKKIIALMFGVVLLSGCGSTVYVTPELDLGSDSVLMQPCTADTPVPQNPTVQAGQRLYDGSSGFKALQQWQLVYDECAVSKDALIKTILDLQKAKKIKLKGY